MGRNARSLRVVAAIAAAFVASGAGLVTATLGATPAVAAGQQPDAVSAKVAPGSKTSRTGNYFAFSATPGSSVTQTVLVKNDNTHAVEAHVDGVDGFTSDSTGASYGAPGSKPTRAGKWIVVSTPVVTLQPGEQRPVAFTVHVPAGATTGVHLAGISAAVPLAKSKAPKPATKSAATLDISLQPQRVIAVEVTVPGPKAPKIAITGARATALPSGVALVLDMANTGNDYARGTGEVTVSDTGLRKSFKMDTFVPGTRIRFRVPWTKGVVPGTHPVSVLVRYGDHRLDWSGTVVISGATQRDLQDALKRSQLPSDAGFPILLVGLGAGVALLCALGVVVLRRRRASDPTLRPVVN